MIPGSGNRDQCPFFLYPVLLESVVSWTFRPVCNLAIAVLKHNTMPNYIFTDKNSTKHSLTEQQLQSLINRGTITPDTPLETDTGHTGYAGQIPGLNFNNAVPPPPFSQPAQAVPRRAGKTQQSGNSVGGSIVSWLFDFAFRDLRLPVINLWACRIIYVICCIAAILWCLGATVFLVGNAFVEPEYAILNFVVLLPLTWLCTILFILLARLFCEWYIIVFDWIVETTKAARKYNDE